MRYDVQKFRCLVFVCTFETAPVLGKTAFTASALTSVILAFVIFTPLIIPLLISTDFFNLRDLCLTIDLLSCILSRSIATIFCTRSSAG